GSTARGSGNYINGAILRQVFNAPVRQILGFPGSAEQRIAIERGELDGDCGSYSSIPAAWIKEKKDHPFVRFTEQLPPEIPESAAFIGSSPRPTSSGRCSPCSTPATRSAVPSSCRDRCRRSGSRSCARPSTTP